MSHHVLQHFTTHRRLELIHMDLMGAIKVESLGGKKYSFVLVDDFSRYTWVYFLKEKSDTFDVFRKYHKRICNLFGNTVSKIRYDHGREFDNTQFSNFCFKEGVFHQFSAPKTPQ